MNLEEFNKIQAYDAAICSTAFYLKLTEEKITKHFTAPMDVVNFIKQRRI